jgi:hypothetical protein
MQRLVALFVFALVAGVFPAQLNGQSYELPEYTDAQRWNRASTLFKAVLVGDIAKGMRRGMTAEQVGEESARLFGPPEGWNGADTPWRLFRGMYNNWILEPDQTCDVLEASETLVRARCNRPYLDYFGESGEHVGVSVEDYDASLLGFASYLADYHGMEWSQEMDGDYATYTIRVR